MTSPPPKLEEHPGSYSVGEAMRGPPLALSPDCTLREACRILRDAGATEAVVAPAGNPELATKRIMGIVTQSDVIAALAAGREPSDCLVRDVMQPEVFTIDIASTVDEALAQLHRLRVHRLPVTAEGRLLGLLTVDSLLEARSRELDQLRITNASLASAATHDPLTRLANRRLFEEVLPREVARARRTGRALGLLMLDIDHFKKINDDFGHQRGDLVLKELAGRLLSTVRRADLVARFGGEEFVVLASVPGREALLTLAEKLRKRACSEPFRQEPRASLAPRSSRSPGPQKTGPLTVTISVGAALLGEDMDDQDLVASADRALYDAKDGGRNRVCWDSQR